MNLFCYDDIRISSLFYFCFFFFQAEDGIRDKRSCWSSDVCSSDLGRWRVRAARSRRSARFTIRRSTGSEERRVGKEWNACVDLGGRRIIKKKKKEKLKCLTSIDDRVVIIYGIMRL